MRWVDYLVLLLGGSMVKMSNLFSIVASFLCRVDFVDFWSFLVSSRCNILVVWILGKCLWNASDVSPGQDQKYPFLIYDIHVYKIGESVASWRYLINSCCLDVWFILFGFLVGLTWGLPLLDNMLYSESEHNTVWWSLRTFSMLHHFLIMLTACLSKIDLHPASQRFPIEMS